MSRPRAWLTPDSPPSGVICRLVWLPNGPEYEDAARGALAPLMVPENWEQHGSITPEEAAQAFQDAAVLTYEWLECSEFEFMQYIQAVDEKNGGVHGGDYDADDGFIVRDLNQIYHDGTGEATLAANKLGIPAGRYTARARQPVARVGAAASYLYIEPQNVNDFTPFALYGQSGWSQSDGSETCLMLAGYFEIEHAAYLRVYMRGALSVALPWALGVASGFLTKERYTSLELWRWLAGAP